MPCLTIRDPHRIGLWARCYHTGGWNGSTVSEEEFCMNLKDGVNIKNVQYQAADEPGGWNPMGLINMPGEFITDALLDADFGVKAEVVRNDGDAGYGGKGLTILNETGFGVWWRLGYYNSEGWSGRNIGADTKSYHDPLSKPYDKMMYQKNDDSDWDPQGDIRFSPGDTVRLTASVRLRLVSSISSEVEKFSETNPFDQLRAQSGIGNTIGTSILFTDLLFPADRSSWVLDSDDECKEDYENTYQRIVWKRPSEFMDKPELIVNGTDFGDVIQGTTGDCWLCGAFASLANCKGGADLIRSLFTPPEYNPDGLYTVKLFFDGSPWYIHIDDQLPVDQDSNRPISIKSSHPNELWATLLEKAFAKWGGCYNALRGGLQNCVTPIGSGRAAKALTGSTQWKDANFSDADLDELWTELTAKTDGSIGSRFTMCLGGGNGKDGIVGGHCFTLLGAYEVTLPDAVEGVSASLKNAGKIIVQNQTNQKIWYRVYGAGGGWSGNTISADSKGVIEAGKAPVTLCMQDAADEWSPTIELADVSAGECLKVTDLADASGVCQVNPADAAVGTIMQTAKTGDTIRLVRIRNPWASSTEWTGLWSDNCYLWAKYPSLTGKLQHVSAADGVFFMLYDDFTHYFSYVMSSGPF